MTRIITNSLAGATIVVAMAIFAAAPAYASEVTGTLSSGASTPAPTTPTGTLSGSVSSGSTLSSTVSGGGGGGGNGPVVGSIGGGGGGGGSPTVPQGQVLGASTGPIAQTDGTGGGGDEFTPGVPATGAGGDVTTTLMILIAAGSLALFGKTYLFRTSVSA